MLKRRLAVVAMTILLVLTLVAPVGAIGRDNFDWIVAKKATIQNGGLAVTGDTSLAGVSASGDLAVTGDTTLTGTLDVVDATTVDDLDVGGDAAVTGTLDVTGMATVDDLTVGGDQTITGTLGVTGAVTVDDATVGGDLGVTGGLTVTGDTDVGNVAADVVVLTAGTAITVTDGAAFAPVASYQPIQAAGTVTPTLDGSALTAGTIVTLENVSAETITVADTGTQMLSAAWAAGQYDVLVLLWDGTNFIEISRSDN